MGMSGDDAEQLRVAAMLHDVGMLEVPESILNAPRLLTPEEHRELREHPLRGAELTRVANFAPMVQDAILSHHERVDGTGYPRGLRGDEIPLAARILACASRLTRRSGNCAPGPGPPTTPASSRCSSKAMRKPLQRARSRAARIAYNRRVPAGAFRQVIHRPGGGTADAEASKAFMGNHVWVRIPPRAPGSNRTTSAHAIEGRRRHAFGLSRSVHVTVCRPVSAGSSSVGRATRAPRTAPGRRGR
jgi:hypothetical protein